VRSKSISFAWPFRSKESFKTQPDLHQPRPSKDAIAGPDDRSSARRDLYWARCISPHSDKLFWRSTLLGIEKEDLLVWSEVRFRRI
jgi:hypothetical protein